MDPKYKTACSAYLREYIKTEKIRDKLLTGWYHYIDDPKINTFGIVATAQTLEIIKKCGLPVSFDCTPMVRSLINTQNNDGGWSYRSNYHSSATEPTARAVQALLLWNVSTDEPEKEAIEKGIEWLLKYRNNEGLWGPIGKKEKESYLYFSCVVLQCFHNIFCMHPAYISGDTLTKIKEALDTGYECIISFFKNNDDQCGWGITNTGSPTLFHTAYVIYTLNELETDMQKHQVIKSLAFLKEHIPSQGQTVPNGILFGESEKYQHGKDRIQYTHSADVYIILALLCDPSNINIPKIKELCELYCTYAEKSDWRYREYVTSWRLYDIVSLCEKYYRISNQKKDKNMEHYKIALTFPGELRQNFVETIAEELSKVFDKSEILYDDFHTAVFARPQLDTYLQHLYHDCSELIVVFISKEYTRKKWCGAEWRAIRDILNNFDYNRIMYVKAGGIKPEEIQLPGFFASEDGYIDADKYSPKEISEMIIERYNTMQ